MGRGIYLWAQSAVKQLRTRMTRFGPSGRDRVNDGFLLIPLSLHLRVSLTEYRTD